MNTIILIEGGRVSYKSTAALRIARNLRFPWRLAGVFLIIPEKIRDLIYDFIGQRRYKWFGKMDTCWLPDPRLAHRFLNDE